MLAADSEVEQDQDEEGEDSEVVAEAVAELLLLELELSEETLEDDSVEDVEKVVGSALWVVCEVLETELVVDSDVAELGGSPEAVEEGGGLVEEGASSVTVCVVTIVMGAVAVTVVGDSGGTTEMSVLVTVFVVSFWVVAVTVTSGVAVGDDVTVCTTVVVVPFSVSAGLPPSMGTIE